MAVVVANAKVAVVATTPVDQSDDEVTQIWQEVQAMVIRMAGGDPNKIDKQLDIDGVLRHLEQVQAKDQKAAEKHAAVKDTFSKTLQVISKVGGLVAEGVSNVRLPLPPTAEMTIKHIIGFRSRESVLQRAELCYRGMAIILGGV